jgi:hypothetical protein
MQRLRGLLEPGAERTIVQWLGRWFTVKDAMDDAPSLQFARIEMVDDDIISILSTGRFAIKDVADRSGRSESTVLRLKKVSDNALVKPLIKDDFYAVEHHIQLPR